MFLAKILKNICLGLLILNLGLVSFAEQANNCFSDNKESKSKINLNLNENVMASTPRLEGGLTRLDKFKIFMRGEEPKNQIIGGMWSKHFSDKDYRENHKIVGLQYKGFWASTFQNSHNRQVTTIGIARTLKKKRLAKDLMFDVGYKVGPMYGYKEGAPDICKFSVLPFLCLGLTYQDLGVSFNIVPGNVISCYTYMNFDFFKKFRRKKLKRDKL